MTAIYTRQLAYAASLAANVGSTLYTVPPNTDIVVRDLVFGNYDSVDHAVYVAFNPPAGGAFALVRETVVAGKTLRVEMRQALPAGFAISWQTDGPAGRLTVTITGYVFVG